MFKATNCAELICSDNVQRWYILLCRIHKLSYRWRILNKTTTFALLHAVDVVLQQLQRRILQLKFRHFPDKQVTNANDALVPTYSKAFWGNKWLLYNTLRSIIITMITPNSKIKRFQSAWNLLHTCWTDEKLTKFLPAGRTNRYLTHKSTIYVAMGVQTKVVYIGMTTSGLKNRTFQHLRYLYGVSNEERANGQIPWYKCGVPAETYVFLPLWSGTSISVPKLRLFEHLLITWYQPCGNTPWVHARLQAKQVNDGKACLYAIHINRPVRKCRRIVASLNSYPCVPMLPKVVFQLTKIELLERLANGRRKENGLIRVIQNKGQGQIHDLLNLALRFFSGSRLSTILGRIHSLRNVHSWNKPRDYKRAAFVSAREADCLTKISVKLPFTRYINTPHTFLSCIKGIAAWGPTVGQFRTVLVRSSPIFTPTIKEYLSNETRISEEIPCIAEGQCSCEVILMFFQYLDSDYGAGCPLPRGVYRDEWGHIAVRLMETALFPKIIGHQVHSHTRILPPESWFRAHLVKAAKQLERVGGARMAIAARVGVTECFKKLANLRCRIREGDPLLISSEHLDELRSLIMTHCISCEVDKAKYDVSIRCRVGHKKAYDKMKCDLYNPISMDGVCEAYKRITATLIRGEAYNFRLTKRNKDLPTNPSYKFWKDWGLLKVRPKDSAYKPNGTLLPKARPLISYFEHPLRNLYRAACRAGNLLVGATGESISVMDIDKVQRNFATLNEAASLQNFTSDRFRLTAAKFDIDNFYGNVKQEHVLQAYHWTITTVEEKMKLRRIKDVIMIPAPVCVRKTRPEMRSDRHWTHPHRLRPKGQPHADPVEFRNNIVISKRTRGCRYLTREFLRDLMILDMETRIIRVGRDFFVQKNGWPQGSPMGPWVATMVATYYEYRLRTITLRTIPRPAEVLFQRWIDDILVAVVHDSAWDTSRMKSHLYDIINRVMRDFGVKTEDESVFVGLRVATSRVAGCPVIQTRPFNKNEDRMINASVSPFLGDKIPIKQTLPLVMSSLNNVPAGVIKGVAVGQLIACIDKSSTTHACVHAMIVKILEYQLYGHLPSSTTAILRSLQNRYHNIPIRQVKHTNNLRRHPYVD